jgi:hypothetical protein
MGCTNGSLLRSPNVFDIIITMCFCIVRVNLPGQCWALQLVVSLIWPHGAPPESGRFVMVLVLDLAVDSSHPQVTGHSDHSLQGPSSQSTGEEGLEM